MLKNAIEILKKIEAKGFNAYIVGGFVRDYILGIDSNDIDISTNATPLDLKKIFDNIISTNEQYGNIIVLYNGFAFEITTLRREGKYVNNRKPTKVEYIESLEEDLKRRDFTINTICMNSSLEIIDLLEGSKDIKNQMIKAVRSAYIELNEDALRILRAIRFATILNFNLDSELENAIVKYKHLLKNISFDRKKIELDKIFCSKNAIHGIQLIKNYKLDIDLELNVDNFIYSEDLIYMWASIDFSPKYTFKKHEMKAITMIKELYNYDNLNNIILYKYGLYVNVGSGMIKGIDKKIIIDKYNSLPIKSRSDILINNKELMDIIDKKMYNKINNIYEDLEYKILNRELVNTKLNIKKYIINNYLGDNNEKQ